MFTEIERDQDDPRDAIERRAKRRREREAWEWEQADKDYAERSYFDEKPDII